MAEQLSMFSDVVKPKGFHYISNFISPGEEKKLLHFIHKLEWQEVKMYGVTARRRVFHFGLDYSFDSRLLTPTLPPPPFLRPFIDKAASMMKVNPEELAEILISHYPLGAPIGWHRDAPQFEKIFGISLSSSCVMKFRQETKEGMLHYKQLLEQRSAYIMQGEARWIWQHHIPGVKEERFSITFRTLTEKAKSNIASEREHS